MADSLEGVKKRGALPPHRLPAYQPPAVRAIGLDAEDWKVIGVAFVVVLLIACLLIVLAAAAGLAVAVFDAARSIYTHHAVTPWCQPTS